MMTRRKALMMQVNHGLEQLMAYQLLGMRAGGGGLRLAGAGPSGRGNFRRGGCPGFSVSRLARPPSSVIFSRFRKPFSCPGPAKKIAQTPAVSEGGGGGR